MRQVVHQEHLSPCPHLPAALTPVTAAVMKTHGPHRGVGFYISALTCAQSLWRQGLPAQALLQLNRAFSANLTGNEAELTDWPLPYAAVAWIMQHRTPDQFIGNPRRHFQHLATRMVEPRKELRTWRAWACWHLSCRIFPDLPADEKQIDAEHLIEPSTGEVRARLLELGLPGEHLLWDEVCRSLAGGER